MINLIKYIFSAWVIAVVNSDLTSNSSRSCRALFEANGWIRSLKSDQTLYSRYSLEGKEIRVLKEVPCDCSEEGLLVEICGIDGSGKSTLAKGLKASFDANGLKSVILQPTRGESLFFPFLQKINQAAERNEILRPLVADFRRDYFSLYLLSQKEELETLLKENDVVILDRYLSSYEAYNIAFGQVDPKFDEALHLMPRADYTIHLSVPVSVAVQSVINRGLPVEEYETEIFLKKVIDTFNDPNFSWGKSRVVYLVERKRPEILVQEVVELIEPSNEKA